MGTRKKYGSLICRVCLGNHLQKTNNFHLTKLPHTHPPKADEKIYGQSKNANAQICLNKQIKTPDTQLFEQANQNPKYQCTDDCQD